MDTILIVGEVALPFIALSSTVKLVQHAIQCAQYTSTCKTLLTKSRIAGCQLVWPKDILAGEKALTHTEREHCYTHILPDARNEGFDYEPEVKIYPTIGTNVEDPLRVYGYIYDIGPETLRTMKECITQADLVAIWGTAGVVEVNSFQAGTQGLLDVLATKKPLPPLKEELLTGYWSTSREIPPKYSLVIGDATVEWSRRMLDSDGELSGDLVGAGMISYLDSDSRLLCGLLGMYNSDMLCFGLQYRRALDDEWVYSKRKVEEEEEEEEEGDDEDDDDDDEDDEEDNDDET